MITLPAREPGSQQVLEIQDTLSNLEQQQKLTTFQGLQKGVVNIFEFLSSSGLGVVNKVKDSVV